MEVARIRSYEIKGLHILSTKQINRSSNRIQTEKNNSKTKNERSTQGSIR